MESAAIQQAGARLRELPVPQGLDLAGQAVWRRAVETAAADAYRLAADHLAGPPDSPAPEKPAVHACTGCGEAVLRTGRRGRPAARCSACREAASSSQGT
ncbi:hypothetical protein ACIGD1_34380 [Streptomyces sp. NPDC085612]|uniref:hypothetical protein n=1 Tax=Streptomyces sp. NPDC085612 TaxID=3365732 RepID=UPI0037D8FCB3